MAFNQFLNKTGVFIEMFINLNMYTYLFGKNFDFDMSLSHLAVYIFGPNRHTHFQVCLYCFPQCSPFGCPQNWLRYFFF